MAQFRALALERDHAGCQPLNHRQWPLGGSDMADWTKEIDLGAYGRSNRDWGGMMINPAVFFPTILISLAIILLSVFAPKVSAEIFSALRAGAVSQFDWFFMSVGNVILLFCIGVALSPLGKIRLGGTGATPDYSRLSWFAMLFGAGMGIGLVFYGVGEPVTHFTSSMAGGVAAPLGGAAGDGRDYLSLRYCQYAVGLDGADYNYGRCYFPVGAWRH